ncbi:MAG: bifunctional nuclease family protein [Planctomycetota bacterium]
MLVRMELSRILIRELNDFQLIELREVVEQPADDANRRTFPIVIGLPEAQAIERRLKGVEIKRPQTHDLLDSVIGRLGGRLEKITISDLSDHTYYAILDVRRDTGDVVEIDARPSDAIALGIADRCPIWVEETVLEAAGDEDPQD